MRREALAAWLRARAAPAARDGLARAWRAARARPETALAVALVAGVFVMILHWS